MSRRCADVLLYANPSGAGSAARRHLRLTGIRYLCEPHVHTDRPAEYERRQVCSWPERSGQLGEQVAAHGRQDADGTTALRRASGDNPRLARPAISL